MQQSNSSKKIDRVKIKFPSKIDNHLGKGIKNWWEVEANPLCRRTVKIMIDKQIGFDDDIQQIIDEELWDYM